jgi:ABC-type protease/lipase transport system fused ATPase/permease subunit
MAIIGPSGSGKSTLARLLVGVWTPGGGIVRLDGVDLAQWSRGEVGPSIGYVPQDVQLFAGTVAENIARLGAVDSEKVLEAARRAGVHDMILTLRDGYETVVDANSALISPGQRQRIALARALYGNPRFLVLDEPNASLDGDGEIALGEALRALRGEITVIAVTHRTSLVQHMDRLLVLDAGRTKREGPVAEVLAALSGASKSVAHIAPVPRTDRLEGAAR